MTPEHLHPASLINSDYFTHSVADDLRFDTSSTLRELIEVRNDGSFDYSSEFQHVPETDSPSFLPTSLAWILD